jgi:hypothetical protein
VSPPGVLAETGDRRSDPLIRHRAPGALAPVVTSRAANETMSSPLVPGGPGLGVDSARYPPSATMTTPPCMALPEFFFVHSYPSHRVRLVHPPSRFHSAVRVSGWLPALARAANHGGFPSQMIIYSRFALGTSGPVRFLPSSNEALI